MVDARTYHERTNHTRERLRATSNPMDERIRPRPFKAYRDLPSVQLPAVSPPRQPALATIATATADPPDRDHQPLDRTAVATLCHLAAGITQETEYKGQLTRFRAASCTGNLHHIDLYLVCGDLDGLDAGVYHFDPTVPALDVLREGDHRGVLAATAPPPTADAPCWVIATSTWWRNAWKYQARTYRHAFWDGGTVIANLLAASHGLGHRASVVAGFVDDRVTELIGVGPEHEAQIAAVAIGADGPAPTAPAVDPIDPTTEPLSDDRIEYPLIPDAWRQSRLADADAVREWRARCREAGALDDEDGDGERTALDPVDDETASARPLLETVNRRGSKRRFSDDGPSRRQLGTVLDRATRGVPGDWVDGAADGLFLLECYVLATGVGGVEDGTYRFHPASDELERLGPVDRATKTRLALDQEWAGAAHLNVYLTADVDRVVDRLGNRGYRLAQLEAGITLGRLYLAASAHRTLGGTGLTFYDEDVGDHLGPAAEGQLPMTMYGFGRIDPEAGPRL